MAALASPYHEAIGESLANVSGALTLPPVPKKQRNVREHEDPAILAVAAMDGNIRKQEICTAA